MAEAIQSMIAQKDRWQVLSKNGLRNVKKYYSWKSHARTYLSKVSKIMGRKYYKKNFMIKAKSKLPTIDRLIIADIDNTLIGDAEGLNNLLHILDKADNNVGLGIATGRRLTSAVDILNQWRVPTPDIFITSVGSEIHYGLGLVNDRTWHNHLNYQWQPDKIRNVLSYLPGLKLQPTIDQREYKISYFIDPKKAPTKRQIVCHLREHNLKVKVIYSHNAYLDILPIRASKGLAVRYLTMKWGLPPERVLVAGDSGNDEQMLRGNTLGVVVGNYSPELNHMVGKPRIYFADQAYANGIIEGIEYYNFLGDIRIPEENDA
jgi:sucrose-phosphate synthase